MPYKNISELPEQVLTELPLEAQRIYAAAYNMAWEQFHSLEGDARGQKADSVAWAMVRKLFEQDTEAKTWWPKMSPN